MKRISIALLVLQNSAVVLMLRYSRSLPGPKAIPAVVVFFWELVKLIVALGFLVAEGNMRQQLNDKCLKNWRGACKMLVPAGLYLFQNNILFVAISNLDAGVYQVTYQLKILTTAAFHVVMLKRSQSVRQVQALVVLMIGVSLVQLSNSEEKFGAHKENQNMFLGLAAVLTACLSSGFAGVYFEMVLKTTDTGMWMRNCQLAFWSLCLSPFSFYDSWETIRDHGILYGFNWTTIVVIFLQVVGGITVGFVVKYADSVAKGFATSVSIIISTFFSIVFFDFAPTFMFAFGSLLVILATNMYATGGIKLKNG